MSAVDAGEGNNKGGCKAGVETASSSADGDARLVIITCNNGLTHSRLMTFYS